MVVGEAVLVRAIGRGAEGEGDLGQDLRLEDALHADERHPPALPRGAAAQELPWEDVAVKCSLALEPVEDGSLDRAVLRVGRHGREDKAM